MAQQTLNIGTNANDGTGDNLRAAMIKVNENFTEVYTSPGFDLTTIQVTGNEISAVRSNDDLVFKPSGTGAVSFPAIRIGGVWCNQNKRNLFKCRRFHINQHQ